MEVMQSSYTESFPTASPAQGILLPEPCPAPVASIFYPVRFFSFLFMNILPLQLCHGGCARPGMATRCDQSFAPFRFPSTLNSLKN